MSRIVDPFRWLQDFGLIKPVNEIVATNNPAANENTSGQPKPQSPAEMKSEVAGLHRAAQREMQREALASRRIGALEQSLGQQGLALKRGIEAGGQTEYVLKQGQTGPIARMGPVPKTESAPHPSMTYKLEVFEKGGAMRPHYFRSRYDALSWLRTRFGGPPSGGGGGGTRPPVEGSRGRTGGMGGGYFNPADTRRRGKPPTRKN